MGMMAPDQIDARSLQGHLRLCLANDGQRTVLAQAVRTPPFHVQRLLYLDPQHPALAHVTLVNTTAGLFEGDRLALDAHVGAGAAATLTTPTMTRVFGMRDGHAAVAVSLAVAAGGYLEYLPDATILCRAADLRQRLVLDAAPDARVAIGDVLAFGRWAHGERHAYRALQQRTELRYAGTPVVAEALMLAPEQFPDAVGVLGRYAAYGALHLLGGDSEAILAHVRALLERQPQVWAGSSLLPGGTGVAVRALSDTPHALHRVLRLIAAEFRHRTLANPARTDGYTASVSW